MALAGLAVGSGAGLSAVAAQIGQRGSVNALPNFVLDRFLRLPGQKSVHIEVDDDAGWRVSHAPDEALFCGSCFKTFVLASYLQEVEAGRLSESEQLPIDDGVRSVGGGVYEFLTGTAPARSILEAMIAHSDNTATDVAMRRVGVDKVRAFIRAANLQTARVPDSTRRFFSYVAGYPPGVDMGWTGIKEMQAGKLGGPTRPSINDQQTMVCSAADFVSYYKRALRGEFFRKPETLTEFKRILGMADAIAMVVPPDTPAYMKGGSISWDNFYCVAVAGQMIVRGAPVTFSLTLNWRESDGNETEVVTAYKDAVAEVLSRIHKDLVGNRR